MTMRMIIIASFISTADGKAGEAKTKKGITIIHPTGQREVQSLFCYDPLNHLYCIGDKSP